MLKYPEDLTARGGSKAHEALKTYLPLPSSSTAAFQHSHLTVVTLRTSFPDCKTFRKETCSHVVHRALFIPMPEFYGLPSKSSPLQAEFSFIKAKGYIEKKGHKYGMGLYHHYRQAITLLWPEFEWHRWTEMGMKSLAENEINVQMGASDCGKTWTIAAFVMCDWWAHCPDCLWMVSSTELQGAELRVWGAIKHLFNKARARYPWLPGTVLESKHCITTDEISDDGSTARLLTKGIIFIPCKKGGQWVGMSAYAGIKPTDCGRLGHAGDECSFMQASFLDGYANWFGKPNFKGLLTGNPTDIDDPLCKASEPVGGWSNWEDTGKTQQWRSQWYDAWVVAYDGRDSPNFDFPDLPFPKYPYLIGPKKIQAVLKAEKTEDSAIFRSQAVGKPTPGQEKLKVITWQICEQGKAFEDVIWEGSERIHIGACDAAYSGIGGDRCVVRHLEYGIDISGKNVLLVHEPAIVPIKVSALPNADIPEVQIAKFCAQYFTGLSVPPQNFGFDGRATLAVEFAKHWSENVVAVDFGGPATKRPASLDEFTWEGEQMQRRLIRCDEKYSKFVTELWFSVRYAILGQQMRGLDKETAEEGTKRLWRYTKGSPPRIEVETKKEMKERTKQSPDFFDSLAVGCEMARRLGFVIENLKTTVQAGKNEPDWLEKELRSHREFRKKHELSYR